MINPIKRRNGIYCRLINQHPALAGFFILQIRRTMDHKKYDLIYCDPPWDYKNKVSNGAAKNHYSTTSFFNLTHLTIHSIASDNVVLAMWYSRLLN